MKNLWDTGMYMPMQKMMLKTTEGLLLMERLCDCLSALYIPCNQHLINVRSQPNAIQLGLKLIKHGKIMALRRYLAESVFWEFCTRHNSRYDFLRVNVRENENQKNFVKQISFKVSPLKRTSAYPTWLTMLSQKKIYFNFGHFHFLTD